MDPHKAIKTLTEEIINHFRLPKQLCYRFIYARIERAFGIGFDLGRAQRAGRKPIVKESAAGGIVKVYESIKEAARMEGVHKTTISRAVSEPTKRLVKGHYWKYLDPDDYYKCRQLKKQHNYETTNK